MSNYPPLDPGYPMPSAPPALGFMPPPPQYSMSPGTVDYNQQQQQQMSGYMPVQPQSAYPPPPVQQIQMQVYQPGQYDPNVPPGLEHLNAVDHLMVKQKVEVLEMLSSFETNNKYTVKNNLGQKVYYAVEENDMCSRNLFGRSRPFEMRIMDANQMEVMRISRPMRCSSCFFPCFLQECEIYTTQGQLLGSVTQDWSILTPQFTIRDSTGQPVLSLEGPMCPTSWCPASKFQVLSLDGDTKVGKISKNWSGFGRELFSDADYFGISFPIDLDVKIKAVLLAATFLIDFMFFEK